MNIPTDLKYTESHEWIRMDPDGTVAVGITDHAQQALGDIIFVELPAVGKAVKSGEAITVIESVKAASDIYAPLSGEIVAIHDQLASAPEQVNADPYGAWLFKLKPSGADALANLMDADAYRQLISA